MRPAPLYPPLIVVGAHRAGTTMLAGALEQLGVFMGWKKDTNKEALFFRNLNRWMLRSVHAHWDYPQPFLGLLAELDLKEKYVSYLRIMLQSPRLISYTGVKHYWRFRHPARFDFPWGWKDPRNTFTLPLWTAVFGSARVIHVRRHGVDVAASLVARNAKSRENAFVRFSKWRRCPLIYKIRPKKGGFTNSLRCRSLIGGFEIWHEYMVRAESVLKAEGVPVLDLCYERILAQPEAELNKVIRFCGMEDSAERIPNAVAALNPKRAFVYRHDPKTRRFALEHENRLNRFGYSADGFAGGFNE